MDFSVDKIVKNLSDEDFKYLVEKFGSQNLELLEQKGNYPYEYINSFERFNEENIIARKIFTVQQKIQKLLMMIKYQMVT